MAAGNDPGAEVIAMAGHGSLWRGLPWLALTGIVALNFFITVRWLEADTSGWDALGYRVAARQIVRGEGPSIAHRFNAQYGPYFSLAAFNVQRAGEPTRLYLNYPPGFPVLLALPQWLGLPDTVLLPLISTASVLLTCAVGSLLFDRWVGVLAAAIIAATPGHLAWSTSFWADLPGAVFGLAALAAYVSAQRRPQRVWQVTLGIAAGALAAGACFIKYAYALLLLPMVTHAISTRRRAVWTSPFDRAFALAAGVGLIGIGVYNQWLFGGPLSTYYTSDAAGFNFPLISLSYATGPSPVGGYSLIAMLETLWINFGWLLVLSAIGLLTARRDTRLLLASQALIFLTISSVYAWAPQRENARFLVVTFAPLALLAAAGARQILAGQQAWRRPLFGIIIAAIGVTLAASVVATQPRLAARNSDSAQTLATARERVNGSEPEAVFLAYAWNDPIRSAGGRTTLFYRRIPGSEAQWEQQLVSIVGRLLTDGVPVYYIDDREPPLRNSLEIMRRHFELQAWKTAPLPVYRVTLKP